MVIEYFCIWKHVITQYDCKLSHDRQQIRSHNPLFWKGGTKLPRGSAACPVHTYHYLPHTPNNQPAKPALGARSDDSNLQAGVNVICVMEFDEREGHIIVYYMSLDVVKFLYYCTF